MGMAKLLQKVNRHEKSICGKCSHRFVCFGIDNQPCFECNRFTEEVVRCKDCVNYKEILGKDSGKPCGYGSCNNPCAMIGIVYDEDFCSYGERIADD